MSLFSEQDELQDELQVGLDSTCSGAVFISGMYFYHNYFKVNEIPVESYIGLFTIADMIIYQL